MYSSQTSEERSKEEAWIAKYRAALNGTVVAESRGERSMRSFADISGRIRSSLARVLYTTRIHWQKPILAEIRLRRSRFTRSSQA